MTISFDGLLRAMVEQDPVWMMAAALLVMALANLILCVAALRRQGRGDRR